MIIIDQSVPIISAYVPPEAVQDIMGTMFFTLALLLTDVLLRIAIEYKGISQKIYRLEYHYHIFMVWMGGIIHK